MATLRINPMFFEAVERYFEHLPPADDLTLLILKGHLLIEELLRQLVDQALIKPMALKDARLETHQCICLAEAMFYDRVPSWLWDALKKLNSIRNKLAHNLNPVGFEHKVADFNEFVNEHRDKTPGLRSVLNGHPVTLALGDVHSQLLLLLYPLLDGED
ncbi:MAG: hypothetical protein PHQ60_12295 [Sideroxydans sp.]|nr:hypothetical protein [Sideroxydans sp.]